MKNPLNTFVIVYNEEVISSVLTTTREYGRWLEELYGHSVAQIELYMKSKKANGISVLESHPGTKIGKWFDNRSFENTDYMSWFVDQNSAMTTKLQKLGLAELRDSVEIDKKRMIRLYTLYQIKLYIQSNIDKQFAFDSDTLYLQPKQIKIRETDFDKMIRPEVKRAKKKLF